jgi:hypothetical protein
LIMASERSGLTVLSDAIPSLFLLALAACTEDDLREVLSRVDEGKRRQFFSAFEIHNERARSFRLLVHSLASASEPRREYAGHFLGSSVGGAIKSSLATAETSSFGASSDLLTPLVDELGVSPVRLGLVELASEGGKAGPVAGALLLCDGRFKLPGWPPIGVSGDELLRELEAEGGLLSPLLRLPVEGQPNWYEADDRFVADIMTADPILDSRDEDGADGSDGLLNRLIGALDESLAEASEAAVRVAVAVRDGAPPAPHDLGRVVAFGRRFVVASSVADLAREVAGLDEDDTPKSLESLRGTAEELVEFQISQARQTRLRRIGQSLAGPPGLAGAIAEVQMSAERLAGSPESEPVLRDGLLALADLIELAPEDGAWQAIDEAEREARSDLPDNWGPMIVAAVQGRLRLDGVVAPSQPAPVAAPTRPASPAAPAAPATVDADPTPRPHLNAVSDDGGQEEQSPSRDDVGLPPSGDDSDGEETVDITEPVPHQRPRPGAWRSKPSAAPWVSNRTPSR